MSSRRHDSAASEIHVILAECKTADNASREKRSRLCWYADNVNIREQGKSNELDSAAEIEQGGCLAAACRLSLPFYVKIGNSLGALRLGLHGCPFVPATPKRRNWSLLPSCTQISLSFVCRVRTTPFCSRCEPCTCV